MTTHLPGLEFRRLTVPSSMADEDAADFREFTRVRNLVYREIAGNDDDAMLPEELLPHYQPDPDEIRLAWAVVLDGAFIGRVGIDLPLEDGSRNAFCLIELMAAHHGRGIGSAGHALIEQAAREHDRSVLQSWAQHPDADGERLHAPTGFGSIPKDHAARFYLRHGYSLEQIERQSALDLTTCDDTVARLWDEAVAASAGYRIVQWQAPTPAEYAEGFAWMKSRMSTDAPSAELEFDEEAWDAERLARHDAKYVESGRIKLVTAAQHIASGDLVAFNELVLGTDPSAPSHQEDTLVLREHRGHKLGQLVKCAGLRTWRRDIAPDSPKVITYNAEENRPMLDINEAIGFVPVAYNGAWKKVLT
ncbi:GNAT family N-acetyltransferase [Microbacterium sp. VKM Ac-2870]|uniref:GNAT family N-acetyltransferase n=1 Tax=Microbacterium sp. VKM Ac-2870 TaxID=2783825 RepID=UPI00188B8F94|nr:GNAT family N-acetyltransferase [Microbacterium sp. VKM Ac-2870]MBF4560699.1 GNAT family N-acetyltransferase [Microbacterium sp. VKM Ac-2870]